MKETDDLYLLVNSMDKAEKRHFKIFASQHTRNGSNHYMRLFDAYDSLDTFSEAELKNKIQTPSILSNLPTNRFRLTQLILKSLSALHTYRSVDMELRETLKHIEILFPRSLYPMSLKVLQKGKKRALRYERFLILLELLDWEINIILREKSGSFKEKLAKVYQETQNVQAQLEIKRKYKKLKKQFQTLVSIRPRARNEKELAPFKEIVEKELLSGEAPREGFYVRNYYHTIWGQFSITKGDYRQGFYHFKECLKLWEEYPHFKQDDPDKYLKICSSFLNACLFSEYWEEFKKGLESIRSLLNSIKKQVSEPRHTIFHLELLYYMNFASYEAGQTLIREYDDWLSPHPEKIRTSQLVITFYNITLFYFLHSNFSEALKWLNRILNLEKMDTRQDIQHFARTFQLIIHFELNNLDLLEYLFRSTYRYLQKNAELFPLERLILDIFKRSPGTNLLAEPQKSFAEVKEKMLELGKTKGFRRPLGYQETLFWLDSRIQGRSLREVFEQKIRERTQE